MAWVTPKTDWTADDYNNPTDMNRIEGNIEELISIASLLYILGSFGVIKTDWDNSDFPFYEELNRIETNILDIKNQTSEPVGWQVPKTDWVTGDFPDFDDTNRWEQNILALYTMYQLIVSAFRYCGQSNFYCGSKMTNL